MAEPTQDEIDDGQVFSQLGYMIFLVDEKVLRGEEGAVSLIDWRSHTCPRVCRSTFAAETMSCAEALEAAKALRGHVREILHPAVDLRGIEANMLPMLAVTDCKSVFDTMHRDGAPKAPAEKRLILDLAAVRQMLAEDTLEHSALKARTSPLRWVPTEHMLADSLTKIMDGKYLMQVLAEGKLRLPVQRQTRAEVG